MGALRADEQKPLDAPIIISEHKPLDALHISTIQTDPETACAHLLEAPIYLTQTNGQISIAL